MTWATLAAATAVLAVGGGPPAGALDVPFLSQGPLLCGGAAAAMVERFHGRRGVYSDDYAALVREAEGGIRTDDLARALEDRGYRVVTHQGDPEAARRALDQGLPAILLLESGRGRYHYVVLVGWERGTAFLHDPLQGPSRAVAVERLQELRAPARYWTLVVHSRQDGPADPVGGGAAEDPAAAARLAPAVQALREERYGQAETLAAALVESRTDTRSEALAWQVMATARYRAGRKAQALDAWNRRGDPRVDLVVLEGVEKLRWPTVAGRLPVEHEGLLTSRSLALAGRRLQGTPGVRDARVDYRPLPDGSVEVQAFVAEEPAWPGPLGLAAALGDALLDQEVGVQAGPFVSGAERWGLGARWLDADALARLTVSGPVPPLPGVASVELEWRRQRFSRPDGTGVNDEERVQARVRLGEWLTPSHRVEARVGLERWVGAGRRVSLGGALQVVASPGRLGAQAELDGWFGAGTHGRARVRLEGRVPRGGQELRFRLNGTLVSGGAPRSLWDGAGTGRVREPLLRGETLLRGDAIGGPAFGPRLLQGSLEYARVRRLGPARTAAVLFVDGARAWGGHAIDPGWRGSWGIQLEGEMQRRRLEVSLGTGAGDWLVSVRMGTAAHLF